MPDWLGFSTAAKWSKDNAGATDCSRMCAGCEREWHSFVVEGKPDMVVNMLELPQNERTSCGMPYKFVCGDCYSKEHA